MEDETENKKADKGVMTRRIKFRDRAGSCRRAEEFLLRGGGRRDGKFSVRVREIVEMEETMSLALTAK